jgi:hypothetical protein
MKRILASLAVAVLGISTQASAIVGGPFDNGSHSAQNEAGARYQAILTFANGSGYTSFSPEARIAIIQTTDVSTRSSMVNRSVLYYKGIVYVGGAFGMIEDDEKYIQGELNASSDVSNTVQQSTQQAGFFSFSSQASTVSSTVTSSNRSFGVNGNFEARIYQTAPILKFRGKGELSFLSPSGSDSIAGLAFNGYSGLITAINQSVSGLTGVGAGVGFALAQASIDAALAALPAHLAGAGLDATFAGADVRKMKVRGSRRYISSAPTVTSN